MSTATHTEYGNRDVARGVEILRTVVGSGRAALRVPMPQDEREETLAVKRGEFPVLDDVLVRIAGVQAEIEERLASGRTPLPAEPDVAAVTAWAVGAQRRHWGWA